MRYVHNTNNHSHRKLFQRAYRSVGGRVPLHGERMVQCGNDAIRPSKFSDGAQLYGRICVRLFRWDIYANADGLSFGAVCKRCVRIHFFGNGVSVRPVLERLSMRDDIYNRLRFRSILERLGVCLVYPIKYGVKYGHVRCYERATGMRKRRRHMGQLN